MKARIYQRIIAIAEISTPVGDFKVQWAGKRILGSVVLALGTANPELRRA